MRPSPDAPFRKPLDCLKDPRRHNTRHLFHDILLIALCALISPITHFNACVFR
jgi:hypothetical protein